MTRSFEFDNDFGVKHTAENHPMACAVKFYKGVCWYCEPEKVERLIEEEKV